MSKAILIVEDEKELGQLIAEQFTSLGAKVHLASCAEDAFSLLSRESVNVVLTDIRLPGLDGIEMVKKLKSDLDEKTLFYVMSGFSDYSEGDALAAGASGFYSKPADLLEMIGVISDQLA